MNLCACGEFTDTEQTNENGDWLCEVCMKEYLIDEDAEQRIDEALGK